MTKKKTYGLRTRGGASVRKRWTRIEVAMKAEQKCPNCASLSVRRESVGIWSCGKCGYKFAGGAYTPSTKTGLASSRTRGEA
jgi:large subunit ribosomal protein L37Ae